MQRSGVGGAHAWVSLPDEWAGTDLAALARVHGVAIAPSTEFGGIAPGFRIGLGALLSRSDVVNGLAAVQRMLVAGPA